MTGALLALALAALPADTAGPAWAPPPAVARRVAEAVAARWGVAAEAVRLEWPEAAPATPPDPASAPRLLGTGSNGHWTVALPPAGGGAALRLRVRAGVEARAPVAAREIPRGAVLAEEDVALAPLLEWGAPRARGEAPGAGWVARRRIAAGEPLRDPAVGPPLLVRSGEEVRVVWRRGEVTVTARGSALGSASRGERVSVRVDGRRRLEGVAEGPGIVRIN